MEEIDPQAAPSIDAEAHARIRPVVDWLMEQRLRTLRATFLFDGVCRELRACGLPIERVSLSTGQLHPQFAARTIMWDAQAGGAVELGRPHSTQDHPGYLNSPIKAIHDGASCLRRCLCEPDCPLDFPVLAELRDKGYTDYWTGPVHYHGGQINVISIATRRPEGFADLDIAMLRAVLPALGAVMELDYRRNTARGLLDTYLGPRTGARVLSGAVQRGDGEIINAVLWFCDLRGFTRLSEELPLDRVLDLLNDYFDIMSKEVAAHGGEVLKFIGDAMLAAFPIGDRLESKRESCESALSAALEALERVAQRNLARTAEGLVEIRCGIALHVGDVLYGNVGAVDRLDFTVIGPAVNLAARLEALSIGLDQPLVLSAPFAAICERRYRSLGRHQLKGVAEPQEAYTLVGRG